ncbi:hypothetical protein LL266_14875 [Vibrio anguillarum]|uniref:hypothetical protein n=1 Tax=Vibrio anguillarum TaxID=55601 RepID=UPI0016A1F281|nr:hypothetical protein [Vibrio anguillarum]MCC4237778.1 hypothetical protein [Vibrio anguillarum]MDT3847657.1 hypothetical protein [Vibrio anguillarum]NOI05049.1 hypothetical protein [Vibrio anguillarum]
MIIFNSLTLFLVFAFIFPVSIFGIRLHDFFLLPIFLLIPFFLKKIKIKNNLNSVFLSLLFSSFLFVFCFSMYNGFDNANLKSQENNAFNALKWLIIDRNINDFFSSGDYYRNTLIYLRYILFPFYFTLGYLFFLGGKKSFELLFGCFLFSGTLHLIICIFDFISVGGRQSGMFNNPAELSIVALLIFIFSFYDEMVKRKYIGIFISISLLIFSFTFSSFIALVSFFFINRINFYKVRVLYILIIVTSYLLSLDISSLLSSALAKYLYVGSLLNRFNLWSVLNDIFSEDTSLYFFSLGSFPVFTDNVFWYLISGLGIGGVLFFMYIFYISHRNKYISSIVLVVMVQGMLFPGFIMPYFIGLLFFLLGFFYYRGDVCEI